MSNPSDNDDDTTFMENPEEEERITGITIPLNTVRTMQSLLLSPSRLTSQQDAFRYFPGSRFPHS